MSSGPPNGLGGEEVAGELRREIQGRLFQLLQPLTSSPAFFPGGQPISFQREHLTRSLLYSDYYVCEKSDGTRYLLYLAVPPDGPCAFLIDRNYGMQVFPGWSLLTRDHRTIHNDTLLDGELIVSEGGAEFLLFDCLLFNGQPVHQLALPERLGKIQNHVVEPFRHMQTAVPGFVYPFRLQLKKMYKAYGIRELLEQVIPQQAHPNDGLIFTPVHEPYRAGTWPSLLKWKPPELNTVDFVLARTDAPSQYRLLIGRHGRLVEYGQMGADGLDQHVGMVIECKYNPAVPAWTFLRTRPDKRHPNDISVADKILDSIRDNVTKADLLGALDEIHRNWQLREKGAQGQHRHRESLGSAPKDTTPSAGQPAKLEWRSFEDDLRAESPAKKAKADFVDEIDKINKIESVPLTREEDREATAQEDNLNYSML